MRSMTGFGAGVAPSGERSLRVEVRALNHRFQDIRLRLPAELSEHGFFLEQLARKVLGRGRFDVSVRVEGAAPVGAKLSFERAEALYASLCELRDRLAPGTELPLTALLSFPGAFETSAPDPEGVLGALERAFAQAVRELDAMRLQEGRALGEELEARLDAARKLRGRLEERSAELVEHHAARLKERVERLLEDTPAQLPPERLAQEIALLADKSDVTEELVRLDSHFEQMSSLLASGEPVGRKLDFLLQEIGREVNTVGSKSQHAPLSHLVVELKAEIERLREQVQNVD